MCFLIIDNQNIWFKSVVFTLVTQYEVLNDFDVESNKSNQTLLKVIKEDLSKWRNVTSPQIERHLYNVNSPQTNL